LQDATSAPKIYRIIDLDRCWGCRACEVACKQELGLGAGPRPRRVEEIGLRTSASRSIPISVSAAGNVKRTALSASWRIPSSMARLNAPFAISYLKDPFHESFTEISVRATAR